MIRHEFNEIKTNYGELEKLCFESPEPIHLWTGHNERLVMMSEPVYFKLARNFWLDTYEDRIDGAIFASCPERVLIECEDEEMIVFLEGNDNHDLIFMSPIMYNYIAGFPPEYEDDKLKNPPKKKKVVPKQFAVPERWVQGSKGSGAKVISFADYQKKTD